MSKDKRVRIALHPEVFKDLEAYKDKIHYYASKNRLPTYIETMTDQKISG